VSGPYCKHTYLYSPQQQKTKAQNNSQSINRHENIQESKETVKLTLSVCQLNWAIKFYNMTEQCVSPTIYQDSRAGCVCVRDMSSVESLTGLCVFASVCFIISSRCFYVLCIFQLVIVSFVSVSVKLNVWKGSSPKRSVICNLIGSCCLKTSDVFPVVDNFHTEN